MAYLRGNGRHLSVGLSYILIVGPAVQHDRHTTPQNRIYPSPFTLGKFLLIFDLAKGRRLSWLEQTVDYRLGNLFRLVCIDSKVDQVAAASNARVGDYTTRRLHQLSANSTCRHHCQRNDRN